MCKFLPILLALCSLTAATMIRFEEFTKGVSTFASDLYQQCIETDPGNMVISPYSVANALVLLSLAANGKSFDELQTQLHVVSDKSLNADLYSGYHALLTRSAGNATLTSANRIYLQQGYLLKKEFQEIATERLSSGVEVVDFAKTDETAAIINRFVEEKTRNKIKDLMKPEDLSSLSRVVLVNAIYLKTKWDRPFDADRTSESNFYSTEMEKASVNFMHKTDHFNYASLADLDSTVLEMKYAQSELSFLVILPNQRTGLSALETKLKNTDLKTISDQLRREYVKVSMPKFRIEYRVSLTNILMKMGVSEIFDDSKADLSGLLESNEPLKVSDAIHKAFIEVDEEGTEAAAATGIVVSMLMSAPLPPPNPKIFNADHPFAFLIWDRKTKTPIFSGRLTKLEKN